MAQSDRRYTMKVEIFRDAESAAVAAAKHLAEECRVAVAARGRFIVAFSGGSTPWPMLRAMAREQIDWSAVEVLQTDERIVPLDDKDRNLTQTRKILLDETPLRSEQIHAMPVDRRDLIRAAEEYEKTIESIAGRPAVLDLVHLGLGADGHTASLIPGDPVLDLEDVDVSVTGIYHNTRRMTLTYPILARARCILWLVAGREKSAALAQLRKGDLFIPAGKVRRDRSVVFADAEAATGR